MLQLLLIPYIEYFYLQNSDTRRTHLARQSLFPGECFHRRAISAKISWFSGARIFEVISKIGFCVTLKLWKANVWEEIARMLTDMLENVMKDALKAHYCINASSRHLLFREYNKRNFWYLYCSIHKKWELNFPPYFWYLCTCNCLEASDEVLTT